MKAVILAGGKGSRISEESRYKPKPLINIAGKPIIWHIMKLYSFYGVDEFIICCGYKGHLIKEYFVNYNATEHDNVYFLQEQKQIRVEELTLLNNSRYNKEHFKITLVDTGLETLTAGRLLKVRKYLENEEQFYLTYGDGVADIDLNALHHFHNKHGKCVTITTCEQEERFGTMKFKPDDVVVDCFKEKKKSTGTYINAGFMVMNHEIFDYLGNGEEMLEDGPFEALAANGEMAAYLHKGFWSPMDTLKEQMYLDMLAKGGEAPWMLWNN